MVAERAVCSPEGTSRRAHPNGWGKDSPGSVVMVNPLWMRWLAISATKRPSRKMNYEQELLWTSQNAMSATGGFTNSVHRKISTFRKCNLVVNYLARHPINERTHG